MQDGTIRANMKDKYNQINKFIEILANLFKKSDLNLKKSISILDCGSGKSYLTFALYDYFTNDLGKITQIIGIELRKELVEASNKISSSINFNNLSFITGNINIYPNKKVEIITALHACDTATDDSIVKGILSEASIIVVSPCCHKYVRKNMVIPEIDKPILRYGIHLERFAEMLTDSLRALTLCYYGYETQIMEFVPSEHTAKNILITAIKKTW